jgi:ribonuclease T2
MLRTFLFLCAMTASAWGQNRDAPRGTAGEFDFYLLTLSWSPRYCASAAGERDKTQCGGARSYEFVLHGLWPQYERGWPQSCPSSQTLSNSVVEKMLDVMPSRQLIRHEWEKHGVCTGATAEEYFAKARAAFTAIQIPPSLRSPRNARTVAPVKIRDEFMAANRGLVGDAISVTCAGRFLSEVRVCLGKDMKSRPCPAPVQRQGCHLPEIIVQPVR